MESTLEKDRCARIGRSQPPWMFLMMLFFDQLRKPLDWTSKGHEKLAGHSPKHQRLMERKKLTRPSSSFPEPLQIGINRR